MRCAIAAHGEVPLALERALPVLHVLRDVDHDRARAGRCARSRTRCGPSPRAASGSVTRKQCLATAPMMFETGASWNASRADGGGGHLAADDDDRHRIGRAVAHRRDGVGGARARGDHADADLAARARIARGHEARALLVGRHDQRHRARRRPARRGPGCSGTPRRRSAGSRRRCSRKWCPRPRRRAPAR